MLAKIHTHHTHTHTATMLVIRSQLILTTVIAFSLLLNIFFLVSWIWPRSSRNNQLTCSQYQRHHHCQEATSPFQPIAGWSRRAADAAEMAALFNCSDNGDLYIDTLLISNSSPGRIVAGLPFSAATDSSIASDDSLPLTCECYECFTGPHCADLIPDCEADVDSGDPLLFAPFWKENAEESAVLIPGWYRMGYRLIEASSTSYMGPTPALEREIRTLHTLVGNAVVDNKYIVLGVGSTQLLNAAVTSLSPTSGNPASVVSAVPYYEVYRSQTEMFQTSQYAWAGDATLYADQQSTLNGSSIEFVTSPNNPDATIRTAVLNGSTASTIYDLAYYWPHFTAITTAYDHDVMLFTLSKVTGHAGSRIGWAIVKDYSVYTRLMKYLDINTVAVAHESQLRATQLLSSINRAYSVQKRLQQKLPLSLPPSYYAKKGLSFHYGYAVLRYRWKKLSYALEASQRLSLPLLEPNYCHFFEEVTGPSPAYAWVQCMYDAEEECQALFTSAGIIGRSGSRFGSTNRYMRLSLLKRDSVFENLADHLSALVSKEISDESLYAKATA